MTSQYELDEMGLELAASEMGLTKTQLETAKREGVKTLLGLRRIEKNSRRDEIYVQDVLSEIL